MIVVGVLAGGGADAARAVAARSPPSLLIQVQILLDCSDGELARWRQQFSPAGIYLDRFAHYVTETLLPIALGIRADGGWDEIGTLHDARAASRRCWRCWCGRRARSCTSRARRPASRSWRTPSAVAAPRASGLRAAAPGARLLPVLPRLRGDRGDAAGAARPRCSTVALGDLEATRGPRDRARPGRGDHRRRAPVRDPRLGAAAVSVRLRRADAPAAGRTTCGGASTRCCARRASRPTSSWSATAAGPTGCPTACAVVALAGRRRHPGRAQRRRAARRRRAAVLPRRRRARWRRRTRWRASRARFAADPALGLLQLRVEPRDGGARARDWVPRLRVGDRARVERHHRRVGGRGGDARARCSRGRRLARADFRFVHEGIDLGWRVMDAGWRVALRGRHRGRCTRRRRARRTATRTISVRATGSGSRAGTCRCRWASLYVASFALRTLPRLRSRQALRRRCAGTVTGCAARRGPRRRCRAGTLARMTRAGRPPIM